MNHCTPLYAGPNGPPLGVWANITSSSNISVSWLPPEGGADKYVIRLVSDSSQQVLEKTVWDTEKEEQEGELEGELKKERDWVDFVGGLNQGRVYDITLYAYKNLPSIASVPVSILFDGKNFAQLYSILSQAVNV